jgi:cation diffusion facilitator family transporter
MNDKRESTGEFAMGAGPDHVAGHEMMDTSSPARYQASRRVTHVSLLVNALLSSGQIAVGVLGHSQALVADGVHTLSDIATDIMVLFALKHGAREADESHPYGHGRIETAITVVLGGMLIAVAVGIAINAGLRIADPGQAPVPSLLALVVAVVTILSKEGLYRFTLYTAERCKSNLLRANAWHHRSDAISSIIVFTGIAGSIAGFPYLDGIAAVGVAMMIAKIGGELAWTSVKELVDTALDAEEVEEIERTILSVDGVRSLHLLRTRRMGGRALVDVHILVDSRISVSEGHHISETVRASLIDKIEHVTDVMVHIDPEDDEQFAPSADLPLRRKVMEKLNRAFADIPEAERIQAVRLDYLNGRVHVELLLPLAGAGDNAEQLALKQRFQRAVRDVEHIGSLSILYR